MIVATLDTRHFSFVALGETERDALIAIRRGWNAHRKLTRGHAGPWSEFADSVRFIEIAPGQCSRDGEPIS
jgi:hypothetical protein